MSSFVLRVGGILALPKDGAHCPTQVKEIPWHFAAEVMDYARIMKGTVTYMIDQCMREVEDLRIMQQEDEAMLGEDGECTKKAVASIEVQIDTIKGMGNPITLISLLTSRMWGARERKKRSRKSNLIRTKRIFPLYTTYPMRLIPAIHRAPFRGRKYLHRTNLRQQY